MSNVFVLKDSNGHLYHPSLQATVLAKYSRSPESAIDLIQSLTKDESEKFHEKWVVNYGHSSVAELSVIPICFEGVSMIASKFIESFQRAGYSEKSTRYQKFSRDSFVNPIQDVSVRNFIDRYYEEYDRLTQWTISNACKLMGLPDDEKSRSLPKVKARAYDSLRYLLPAGTGTNLAAVMNLRDVRYLVSLARASHNPEIRDIGEKVFAAASEITPSLIKNAEPDLFDIRTSNFSLPTTRSSAGVDLLSYEPNAFEKIKSHVLELYGMSWERFSDHMNLRNQSQVPSVFKRHYVEFLLTMDYGAYRDIQRHRRCEQWSEYLTPYIGYETPDDFKNSSIESNYKRTMESIIAFDNDDIVNSPEIFQYMVPMGYLHRSLFRMDLRELYYLTELRTKPQGHISYRRVAFEMYQRAHEVMPELMKWCKAIDPVTIGDHL